MHLDLNKEAMVNPRSHELGENTQKIRRCMKLPEFHRLYGAHHFNRVPPILIRRTEIKEQERKLSWK
jgi:hypothetical protein